VLIVNHLNQVLGWFGFQWVEEDAKTEEAKETEATEAAVEHHVTADGTLEKQVVILSLTQVISNKLSQDRQSDIDTPEGLNHDFQQDSQPQDLTQYVQHPALNLPEAFTEGIQRYLLGYPQHVKSLFYFETIQGDASQLHLGLLASDRNPKAGTVSENEINEDWLAVSFIPFLEGLLDQHLEGFPGELNLVLLDEKTDLMSKVLHRIQPLYTSHL
jgi:hypothetical protein